MGVITFLVLVIGLFDKDLPNLNDLFSAVSLLLFVLFMIQLPMTILFGIIIEVLGFKALTQVFFKRLISAVFTSIFILAYVFCYDLLYFFVIPCIIYYVTTMTSIWIYNIKVA